MANAIPAKNFRYCVACLLAAIVWVLAPSVRGEISATASAQTVPSSEAQIRFSFSPVVKRTAPAVVNVYARKTVQQRSRSPFAGDPFFERFFGRRFDFGMPRERVSNSLGSGVIVSADGVIVTNHHVVKDSSEIRVALADRREFEARVLQSDRRTDLAILKIVDGAEAFPHLEFADSDAVEIGDLVLAVGNPFGIGQTVTGGIVSALARTQLGVSDYRFFIQTDAAINPGNSGGPLVDIDGRIIGINTAIYSRSGGSNGIGFAIPSNMVRLVVEAAVSGETIRRPWLGASFQKLTPDLALTLGLDRPAGALVTELYPGGPLEAAGLNRGDVILKVDDIVIDDPEALSYRLTTSGIGNVAELEVQRGEARYRASLPLQVAPEEPPRDALRLEGRHALAGAHVANLSPAVAEELDRTLMQPERAVIVTAIDARSPARQVGLKRGDLIIGIDGQRIGSVDELVDAIDRAGSVFELAVRRGNRVVTSRLRGR